MDILTTVALAIGLSFDTFAVSLSFGLTKSQITFFEAVKIAVVMALFQAGFTFAGYFLGSTISDTIESFDHWIAFGLLGFLGVRMIIEGRKGETKSPGSDFSGFVSLITMATGTSLDALAVGISLAFLGISILFPGIVIGFVTFISSMIAIRLGKDIGKKSGKWVEVAGGLILIAIGFKILMENLL